MRFLLEGEWTGHTASQQKIVHREVLTNQELAETLGGHSSIEFDDGTALILKIRELQPAERVKDLKGAYSSLIRDCARDDVWSVAELQAKKGAKR